MFVITAETLLLLLSVSYFCVNNKNIKKKTKIFLDDSTIKFINCLLILLLGLSVELNSIIIE
jgi:hypothetical protein